MTRPAPISTVSLIDLETVWLSDQSKTISYFSKKTPVRVGAELIRELKQIAEQTKKNVRLCLHLNPDAPFHEMIILEHAEKYYRPHKHLEKGESYHIIEGSLAIFTFSEDGKITDRCLLSAQGDLIYRIGSNVYHAIMPQSKFVIYHESKPGPFNGKNDSLYAAWAPDGMDQQENDKFNQKLLDALEPLMEPVKK